MEEVKTTQQKTGSSKAEEYKTKYGKVYAIAMTLTPDDETEIEKTYFFKKPNVASYDRYVKTASNGMTKALKTFMFDSVIEENKQQLVDDLEEYPALAISVGEKLLAMMGLAKDTNLRML
ncbi:MAG: hypothetical protein LBQ71_12470 [Hungatella sp.]|jgi:hypothetical protein|nr:hypothetical protein [Hungatella sp.]